MLSRVAIFLFGFLFGTNVYAQLTLQIIDSKLQMPLSQVSVEVESMVDNENEFLFSDSDGIVSIHVPVPFEVHVFTLGYYPYSDSIYQNENQIFYLKQLELNLNQFTVTGEYGVTQKDQSVYNVNVIDRKTIEQKGSTNLKELLENEIGVRINQDNILGSSINLNGLSGQNVKVLIDGVQLIGRENGNLDLSSIHLNNIEKVEIIEGPMSVMYGTDALGGVINLITKQGSFHPFNFDLNNTFESIGTYNTDAFLNFRIKHQSISLNGGRYFFDGFNLPDTGRFQSFKPKLQYFFNAQYELKSSNFNIRVKSDNSFQVIQNKGQTVITPYSAYAFDDYYLTRRINQSIDNDYRLNNNSKLTFTNAFSTYRHIKNTYRKNMVDLSQDLINQSGSQDTSLFTSFLFRGSWSNTNPFHKITFQTGYDFNLDHGEGIKLLNGLQHINDFAFFGSFSVNCNSKLSIRPGLRITYNTRYGAPVIPSLNIKWNLKKQSVFRFGYARGFRSPSMKELDLLFTDANHNIRGNENLVAETSNNFETSLTLSNAIESTNVNFEVSSFFNDIHHIITLALVDQVSQLFTYVNIDQYQTTGLNFELKLSNQKIVFTSGFQMLGTYNSLSESYASVTHFSLSPEFQNDLTIHLKKINTDLAVYFKNVGTTPGFELDDEGKVFETFIQPYNVIDLSVKKKLLKGKIDMVVGIKNLLNVVNISTTALNNSVHSESTGFLPYAMGRYGFITVHYHFKTD